MHLKKKAKQKKYKKIKIILTFPNLITLRRMTLKYNFYNINILNPMGSCYFNKLSKRNTNTYANIIIETEMVYIYYNTVAFAERLVTFDCSHRSGDMDNKICRYYVKWYNICI